jgi:hypothetical protein
MDLREATNDYDIYLQRVLASGALASGWPEEGLPLCTLPQQQVNPQLVTDGNGGVIVVWNDYRRGAEIYAQRIDSHGRIGDQITVVTASQAILTVDGNNITTEWQIDVQGIDRVEVLRSSAIGGVERLGTALINGSHRARFTDLGLPPGRYGYAVAFPYQGTTVTSEFAWTIVGETPGLKLHGFRPNPSNGNAPISYVLPEAMPARVEIFDIRGRRVRDLRTVASTAGPQSVQVGARLSPGIYWIKLVAGARSVSARGVVLESLH